MAAFVLKIVCFHLDSADLKIQQVAEDVISGY